ncbi:MAG: class I SAM-dependent methyltransferase [Pseudomonadota bacterium]
MLRSHHTKGARLYADRFEMIVGLAQAESFSQVCEVGVAKGTFSNHLMATLCPDRFYAIDVFKMHDAEPFWGKSAEEHFFGKTHREFYEATIERVALAKGVKTEIMTGLSWDCMAKLPENGLDFIYLDADHSFDAVQRDIKAAARAIRPGGVIVFNDYITYDHHTGKPYGVVQAANAFIVERDCEVLGFALQAQMYCDIAVRVPGN